MLVSTSLNVGVRGIGPPASRSQTERSTDVMPKADPPLAEITPQLVGDRGIGPRTSRSQTERSTDELVSEINGATDELHPARIF